VKSARIAIEPRRCPGTFTSMELAATPVVALSVQCPTGHSEVFESADAIVSPRSPSTVSRVKMDVVPLPSESGNDHDRLVLGKFTRGLGR